MLIAQRCCIRLAHQVNNVEVVLNPEHRWQALNACTGEFEKLLKICEKIIDLAVQIKEKPARLVHALSALAARQEECEQLKDYCRFVLKFKKDATTKVQMDAARYNDTINKVSEAMAELKADCTVVKAHAPPVAKAGK